MGEPSIFELFIAAVGLAAFVAAAWRLASWFTKRGRVIRALTLMDLLMTKTERAAAQKRRVAGRGAKAIDPDSALRRPAD